MRFLFIAAALVLFASTARADHDGDYCVGNGYLAVEFRSGITPGVAKPHVLKIATFDAVHGPRWTGEVVMDDFQPYAIVCDSRRIKAEGLGLPAQGLISYAVELNDQGVPHILSRTTDPAYGWHRATGEPQNLSLWARPGNTPLMLPGSVHAFQLRMTRTVQTLHPNCTDYRSVLEERANGSNRVIRSLLLFSGNMCVYGD
jgi:hypothetical protein